MKTLLHIFAAALLISGRAPAQETREWTSVEGKKITAEFLGVQESSVALKVAGGQVSLVPLVKLSEADNAFVRKNSFVYHPVWRMWPPDTDYAMRNVPVKEEPGGANSFLYTTPHFRFRSDVNLGTPLMKDLAQVFELTYSLHTKSPFGILAQPKKDLFDARLFGTTEDYMTAGGLPNTAGIYLLKDKAFLAPLELMGVRPGSAGWRKDSNNYDLTTVIHELTHMLTHDMLNNLPVWVNEGYAEYISNIPIENGSFRTSNEKIREGILNKLVKEQDGQSSQGSQRIVGIGDRVKFQKSGVPVVLHKVEKVLQMGDHEWQTGQAPGTKIAGARGESPYGGSSTADRMRLPRLYRTSHLILYYFIQIEGEKGVTKVRRFLNENQKSMAGYLHYVEDFTKYEAAMEEFMKQPGVTRMEDGRISYPSTLQVPKAPDAPFKDSSVLKLGGLGALLDGDTASVVGARIENALADDLGAKLRFE